VHSVDLLRFLAGSEVVAVTAAGGNLVIDGLGDIDNVVATLEFASGSVASLLHGTAGQSELLSVWSFQTAGRGVNATIHAHGRRVIIRDAGVAEAPRALFDGTSDPFAAGTAELLEHFITAVETGDSSSATGRDGTMGIVICRAIEEAVATGTRRAVLPPTNGSG
jgi:predicted dehydrogenase